MGFIDAVEGIVSALSLCVRLFILRFVLFFTQSIEHRTAPARKSKTLRTVLLIGDGTAEGIGDTIGHTGLTSRLNALLRERREETNLRLVWRVVTAGRLRTSSSDWHPTAGDLFSRTLATGPFRDADVVVTTFGMHEDCDTVVENATRVAEAVVRLGKHVIVTRLMNPHPPKSDDYARVRAANEELERRLEVVRRENAEPECGTLSFEVDPLKVTCMGGDTLRMEEGFVSFNPRGYRMFASELFDAVVSAAKKVEWTHWKGRLTGAAGS